MKPLQVKWTGKTITSLGLYKRRSRPFGKKFGWEILPFLLLYIITAYHCALTIGEPYALALIENNITTTTGINTPEENNLAASDLLSQDIIREEEEVEESTFTLPNPYLPSLLPSLALLAVGILHGLFSLFQIWFVSFESIIQYKAVSSLKEATFVKVVPKSFRGKAGLVPLQSSSSFFEFQKRKYIASVSEDNVVQFTKLKPPVSHELAHYTTAKGYQNSAEYQTALELYGHNTFHIPQPTFMEMYKKQLIEPLTVFQLFSVFLWMLDEYWQYPLFTLGMILLFEGVTVLSRLKNIQTLRGMGNKVSQIEVYRYNKWMTVSSEDIVPGDIISLARASSDSETIVPCDAVLLSGCAVMNEATLTGESIPQMKEALKEELKVNFDMKSLHKVHTLYGGTTMLQHEASSSTSTIKHSTGCVLYVLRTGFTASQGKLVRMIEFSSGKVTGNTKDALGLALLLLIFALMSSSYVLTNGIKARGKVTFELLLRCVLIITSVIPAELPMQTALAVNTALLTLVKKSIFCTEPFRISLAGKVDICLFDKTGTITTDQLTSVGIASTNYEGPVPPPMIECSKEAAIVLAGCHSLVQIDKKTIGDPVEEASLRAIDFTFDPVSKISKPKPNATRKWDASSVSSVKILKRNHFASKLQRMSVIASVNNNNTKVLVKGSPEVIKTLCSTDVPQWYDEVYQRMAKKGMRVLALAFKNVTDSDIKSSRAWAESDLTFCGFAAFKCLIRTDSKEILKTLRESSHYVTMITGDALLTAIHVATDVDIITKPPLVLSKDLMYWESTCDDKKKIEFKESGIKNLASEYDLCVTGATLAASLSVDDKLWRALEHVRVFARMTPELKERVMITLKKHGHHTLMCGDGANDVGALKQADIGVALLSGFGAANTGSKKKNSRSKYAKTSTSNSDQSVSALKKELTALKIDFKHCREKKELVELLQKSKQQKKKKKTSVMTAEEKKELMLKKQAEIEADVAARTARGESFARVRALAAFAKKEAAEAKAKGAARAGGKGFANSANSAVMAQYMDDFEDGELPMVKLGDASIASPFTSRAPSIKACVDIIRQGRCALVTTMQMYQILAVNCLISSYSLSVMYLDRVKYGNSQMIALGMVSTVSSLTLSRATPLEKLSSVRPLTSIFHPALFASLLGQFGIHLATMIYSTGLAKAYTAEGDDTHSKPGGFVPNVMSTVVFLINGVQTVSVCAVNYKGRPFMKGMADNPGLLYSLGASFIGVFMAATEAMPMFNKALEIVPLPDASFTQQLLILLVLDVFGAFIWDQCCMAFFAPKILKATISETSVADLKKFGKMALVTFGLMYFFANIDFEELERQQRLLDEEDGAAASNGSTTNPSI